MKEKYTFDYFYGTEAEMFAFYRVPKLLVTSDYFRELSSDAKLLYGLMLDRMSLSIKNEWKDEKKRAFIYYSVEEIMESLNCGRNKAIKCLQELDSENGIGLIEKHRQGMGKSSIIYVKNFVMVTEAGSKKFEKQTSRSPKSKLLEVCKKDSNYNNINYIYKSNAESNPIRTEEEEIKITYSCIDLIKEQIEYEVLLERYPYNRDQLDELLSLIEEIMVNKSENIVIGGSTYPVRLVQERFRKLDSMHIEYVLECLQENTSKIKNIKKYLVATLFNAPVTKSSYMQAAVNYGMTYQADMVVRN